MQTQKDPTSALSQDVLFEALSTVSKNVYLFKCNMEQNYTVWTENAISYFGLPSDYSTKFLDYWLKKIHDSDINDYLEDVMAVFNGNSNSHYCQYRIKNYKGEYVWVECIGSVIYQDSVKYFIGIVTRLDNTSKYDAITKCLTAQQFYSCILHGTIGILLVGIDSFKNIVNNYGYVFSNHILKLFADVMRRNVNVKDVFHLSGDKFIMISTDSSRENAKYYFQKIFDEFRDECRIQFGLNNISFSGAALKYDADGGETRDFVIKRLDRTLQYSKKNSSGNLIFYTREIEDAFIREHKIKNALSEAILNDFKGFELHFQPIVSPFVNPYDSVGNTNKKLIWVDDKDYTFASLKAAETLLRFRTDELGLVSPYEFIPYLEESKEISIVGKWVAEQAIKQCAEWNKINPSMLVSFNVSCLQLTDPNFVIDIISYIRKYDVNPSNIIVELTESYKLDNPDGVASTLQMLRDLNVNVFLDDFGMDHSSFTLVQTLPISGLKVDHSFVITLSNKATYENKVNQAIISSINFMCKQLNLKVVVEGVESRDIYSLLIDMGFAFFQGYHFSRPVDKENFNKRFFPTEN